MKKLITALFVVVSTITSAQNDLSGKVIIEPVIGIPNAGRMYGAFLDDILFSDNVGFKITGSPVQYGGRLEYVALPKVGVAFEVNYEKAGFERTFFDYNYNPSSGLYEDTVITWSQTKIRFLGRFMFHFGNNEKVDWYTGAGIGYSHEVHENPENEPYIEDYTFAFFPKLIDRITGPFSARIFLGMRLMFSDNIGLITEFGIGGGSPLTVGLSARFN